MATPAPSSTKKHTLANFFGAIKKPKLTSKELRYAPVVLLYKGYLVSQADAQDDNLEKLTKLCRRFNWIPTIDLVNNIIRKTNIIDEKHRLNFPVYAFMQEFKFTMCVPYTTEQSRLLVGMLPVEGGVVLRFPGLLRAAPGTQDRLAISDAAGHPEYSQSPFTSSKVAVKTPEPKNPYSEALDILNSGPSPADDVHRCHPPDQQLIPGNKATKNNINTLKRKRVGTE
jgi:hypothetical protein